jgi:deoxyribonuclease-4
MRDAIAMKKMFAEFDRVIGRDRLAAIHMNDSKAAPGSRVDRHEHIGKGQIGLAAFQFVMNEPRFQNVPKVLETPKGRELREDVANMRVLRRLVTTDVDETAMCVHPPKNGRSQQVGSKQKRR